MLGDFYNIFPLASVEMSRYARVDEVWSGNQFHRPDIGDGVAIVFRREKCNEAVKEIELRGIDLGARYEVTFEGRDGTKLKDGRQLLSLEVEILSSPGSEIIFYRKL